MISFLIFYLMFGFHYWSSSAFVTPALKSFSEPLSVLSVPVSFNVLFHFIVSSEYVVLILPPLPVPRHLCFKSEYYEQS